MNLQHAHDVAVRTARAAGALLRDRRPGGQPIQHKSSSLDLVTEYDRAVEALIVSQVRAVFPDHRLIGEEGGQQSEGTSPFVWYIDPLDGTTNFAHGFPVYAVSLALYRADQPLVGVVLDPTRDECFSAIAGEGAWLERPGGREALRVSQETALGASLLATGFPYDVHTSSLDNLAQTAAFLKQAQGVRRAGAAALDLAYVAAGRLDGYWEFKLNHWDVAVGVMLVAEAGGAVTAMDGGPFTLSPKVHLVASNGRIHPAMLQVLRQTAAAT